MAAVLSSSTMSDSSFDEDFDVNISSPPSVPEKRSSNHQRKINKMTFSTTSPTNTLITIDDADDSDDNEDEEMDFD